MKLIKSLDDPGARGKRVRHLPFLLVWPYKGNTAYEVQIGPLVIMRRWRPGHEPIGSKVHYRRFEREAPLWPHYSRVGHKISISAGRWIFWTDAYGKYFDLKRIWKG